MWVRVEFTDPTRTRPLSRGDFVSRSDFPSEMRLPRRRVVVLGSTGSIGTNCLDVIASLSERLELLGLSGHANRELLLEQAIQHRFRRELPLADIQAALANGEEPGPLQDWTM